MAFPKTSFIKTDFPVWPGFFIGWASVVLFSWIDAPKISSIPSVLLFSWLFATILWCAFGVVRNANFLALALGEPYGTLILTLSVVMIEVILICSTMAGSGDSEIIATIGRDAIISVMMIIMNGVFGLCLLIGGWRYRIQSFNRNGSSTYLGIIIPLTIVTLIIPALLAFPGNGSLSLLQSIVFATIITIFYSVFLMLQTGKYRTFFIHRPERQATSQLTSQGSVWHNTALMVLYMLPIMLLAEHLAIFIDLGLAKVGAPATIGGFIIALIVFTPEAITACKAAAGNELQRVINLCHGAFASTVGLTVPAIIAAGLLFGHKVVLAASTVDIAMVLSTLLLTFVTFSAPRTNIVHGCAHLSLFLIYITGTFIS